MSAAVTLPPPNQDSLAMLNHLLAMAMHTAETASADANHRIVLQAIREAVKIITLIYKMACPSDPKPAAGVTKAGLPAQNPLSATQPPANGPGLAEVEQALCTGIFSSLAPPPTAHPQAANRQPETAGRGGAPREKGGKIPKKKRLLKKYRQGNPPPPQGRENLARQAPAGPAGPGGIITGGLE